MSWANELYQVFENNYGKTDSPVKMLPIYHSKANAQIQVTISENGDFHSADRIGDKADAEIIIPVTEDSCAKSSGITPHPLSDKLVYIAGDYGKYVNGKEKDNHKKFEAYLEQLEKWKNSKHSHPAVKAVYAYLKKASLMQDLVNRNILVLDETTGFLSADSKNHICKIPQEDCFVRFRIDYQDVERESRAWLDQSLYDSWIAYVTEESKEKQLCYATGTETRCTYKHPSRIRNAGDKAKLFSANDESGFSYRGRFLQKEQSVSIGYEFSQKMHNGLKWLIAQQGISVGNSLMILAWESALQPIPKLVEGSKSLMYSASGDDYEDEDDEDEEDTMDNSSPIATTLPAFRSQLHKVIFGTKDQLDIHSKIMVMLFDSATTGRMAITLYCELQSSDFLQRLETWHEQLAWNRFWSKKKQYYIGSPSMREIAECAYGTEQGKYVHCTPEMLRETHSRLIPCILEGRKIPIDMVRMLVNKASNPLAYDKFINWRKVMEVACCMIRKSIIEEKGVCEMGLDKNCTRRDYLYGRLLAVADKAERLTYGKDDAGRTTNAKRYFETFSNRPYQTWRIIWNRLAPYMEKLAKKSEKTGRYYAKLINEITDQFDHDDFMDNSKLAPEFLHAYSCQMVELNTYQNKPSNEPEQETED